LEEDFVVRVMAVRVEKAKHDDDEDNAITANDASNAVATALRLMTMAVDGWIINGSKRKNLVKWRGGEVIFGCRVPT
jgi:hypothetical protein